MRLLNGELLFTFHSGSVRLYVRSFLTTRAHQVWPLTQPSSFLSGMQSVSHPSDLATGRHDLRTRGSAWQQKWSQVRVISKLADLPELSCLPALVISHNGSPAVRDGPFHNSKLNTFLSRVNAKPLWHYFS